MIATGFATASRGALGRRSAGMTDSIDCDALTRANYHWRYRNAPKAATARGWKEVTLEVANHYGLTWDEILGPAREHRVAHPRQEAFALIWAQGRLSLPAIGRRFNGRDHTTVLHGVRAHEKRLAEAARLADL